TYSSTNIASTYFQVKAGGDAAALKGIAKALLEIEANQGQVLDQAFINEHTLGFEAFAEDLRQTSWPEIERESGLTRDDLQRVAVAYAKSNATIVTYGMGITQHNKGTSNVRL
ncbi:CbbBc protein, partial [Escherichia coli]